MKQGDRFRGIDDYSGSGVNGALSASETIDPDSLDRVGVNARAHMDAFALPAE